MDCSTLTFVNTTGASSLSGPAAKRMRAHITRTNFAKRRERMTGGRVTEPNSKAKRTRKQIAAIDKRIETALPMQVQLNSPDNIAAFYKLQELVFLEGRRAADSPSEAAWFNLIASEPALVEASLAIAARQWSPDNAWQIQAEHHSCVAVNLIKESIMTASTRTDGILGAIITMAFGAALAHDDFAFKIHTEGLTQVIKDRLSRDPQTLPLWFVDFIIHDSVNRIFDFPRIWHPSIIEALGNCHEGKVQELADICDRVARLRRVIDLHHEQPLDPMSIAREIEEPVAVLHYEARGLRIHDSPYIDAAARAIELLLYLLWPTQSQAHLTYLAGELKEAIVRFPIKGCSYMDLSSFHLMIGAVAAEEGSAERAFFIDGISRAVHWMQARGWKQPLELLEKRFLKDGDAGVIGRFRALWKEICDADTTIDVQSS
ncbi:hypothetical protein BJY04DRAFT_219304 [Aspergillus karnatakaensis]|uniref:uncharacterized protein n=1 Tax=Aspergillus karnatakaensis TaxID=1810916 RepID=UPI003CCDCFA0